MEMKNEHTVLGFLRKRRQRRYLSTEELRNRSGGRRGVAHGGRDAAANWGRGSGRDHDDGHRWKRALDRRSSQDYCGRFEEKDDQIAERQCLIHERKSSS